MQKSTAKLSRSLWLSSAGLALLLLGASTPRLAAQQSDNFNNQSIANWVPYTFPATNPYGVAVYTFPTNPASANNYALRIYVPPIVNDSNIPPSLNPRGGVVWTNGDAKYGGADPTTAGFNVGVDLLAWSTAWSDAVLGVGWFVQGASFLNTSAYFSGWGAGLATLGITKLDLGSSPPYQVLGQVADGTTVLKTNHQYRVVAKCWDGATFLVQMFDRSNTNTAWQSAISQDYQLFGTAGYCALVVANTGTPPPYAGNTTQGADATFDNYYAWRPTVGNIPADTPAVVSDTYPPPSGQATDYYPIVSVSILEQETGVQLDSTHPLLYMDGTLLTSGVTRTTGVVKPDPAGGGATITWPGATLTYPIGVLYAAGSRHTNTVVFQDSLNVWYTNAWSWQAYTPTGLNANNSLPTGSLSVRGFKGRTVVTPGPFDNSLANAFMVLDYPATNAGAVTLLATNITQSVAWDIGNHLPTLLWGAVTNFPGQDLPAAYPNYFAVQVQAYLQLAAGGHRFHVDSDDGVAIYSGASMDDTSAPLLVSGGNGGFVTHADFDFFVPADGLYPFNIIYEEGNGDAYLVLHSVDLISGVQTLVNTNGGVLAFYSPGTISPATASAGGNQTICCGSATAGLNGSVGGGATGGTWTSSGSGTFSPNATTLNATYQPAGADCAAGTVTLTLTSTGGAGGVATTNVVVTINPAVTASAGAAKTVCSGVASSGLGGTVGGGSTGGTWTTSGSGTFSPNATTLNASYTPSVADASAGTVTLTLTTRGQQTPCSAATATVAVTVRRAATASAGGNQTIAAGNSTAGLGGSVGGGVTGGLWSSSGSGTFLPNATTLNASYTPSGADASAGTVTLTLASTGQITPCGPVTAQVIVTISNIPGKLQFVNVDASWTDTTRFIYFTTNTSKLVPADRTTTVDLVCGPGLIAGSTLYTGYTFNDTPGTIMSLTGSPTFIAALYGGTSSSSLTLQATSTIDDAWNDSNPGMVVPVNMTFNGLNGTTLLPAGVPAYFQVQVFDSRANPNAVGGGAADAWEHQDWYAGESPIFQATPHTSAYYPIYQTTSPVNSTWVSGTQVLTDLPPSCVGDGYYGAIEVYVNSAATNSATAGAGGNQTTCCGSATAGLNGTVGGGATGGTWTTSGSGTFSPNATTLNATYQPAGTDCAAGTVTLTLTSTGGAGGVATTNVVVTINPAATANAGGAQTVCSGVPSSGLGGIVGGGATGGTWTSSGTGTFAPNTTTLNSSYTPSVADALTGTVTLTLTTTGQQSPCGAATARVVVTVTSPLPAGVVFDNFNSGNDSAWRHLDLSAVGQTPSTYSFPPDGSDGYAYRIFSPAPSVTTYGDARAYSYRTNVYSDFYVAVDLAAWDNSLNQGFGIGARVGNVGIGQTTGYILNYDPNQYVIGGGGQFQINRVTGEQTAANPLAFSSISLDPTHKYRMVAVGSGSVLTASIYDLSNLTTPLATITCTDINYPSGMCALVSASRASAGNADATFDNYFAASNQPTPVLTWTNPAPIIYGTVLGTNQLNAAASVPGTFNYAPSPNIVLAAGTNLLSVVFTPDDLADYTSATGTAGLVVIKAPLIVSASNATRPFGQTNPVFTGTITGVTNGDNITAQYTCNATPSSPPGTYPIVPNLQDPNNRLENYTVTTNNGILSVTSAANGRFIIVNTTNNVSPGPGQTNLVQAISLLHDGDTIGFNIPGSGVQYLLTPPGGYPLITNNNVTIDGYSQPGAAPNTNSIHAANNAQIKIVLDSRNGNGMSMQAAVEAAAGVYYNYLGYAYSELATLGFFRGSNAVVRGLAFVSAATAIDTVRGYSGDLKTISFCPDSLETGGTTANCGNWRVSGCWFGLDPATGQLAYMPDSTTVAVPAICVAAYGTQNNDGTGASWSFPWPGTVGVARNASNAKADFNVIMGGSHYGFDGAGHDFRISGNFWDVLPDGLHNWDPEQAGQVACYEAAFIEIGEDNSNLTIGTDGDGVNDADEGNVFGGIADTMFGPGCFVGLSLYGQVGFPNGGHGTNCVIAGNYFGVAIDGVTRFTNSLVLVDNLRGGSSSQAATVRFGSDFDGVSDAVEANLVYNSYPFASTYPNPGGQTPLPVFGLYGIDAGVQLSFRGNVTVGNDLLPFKYANGQGTLLTAFANYEAPYMVTSGALVPTLSTNSAFPNLSGTFALGIAPYTNIIIDVYQLDPEGWANGKLFAETELINSAAHTTNGFPQGRNCLGSVTVANTGTFNITVPGGAGGGAGPLTVTVNYSADPPGTHNGRVHTSNFSTPAGFLAATPVMAWANPAAITYGMALSTNQLNATASVPGSFVYAPTNGAVLNAGTNTLSVTFTPNDTTNYTSAASSVSLVVMKAPLSVTASNATRPFGQSNPVFTGTITGVTNGDNILVNYTCGATPSSPPGPYLIVPSLLDPNNRLGNYSVTTNYGTLTVQGNCVPTPTGLVACWPMNGAVNDVVGTNNPSATNAISYVPGEVGPGVTFGNGGYIDIPDSAALENQTFSFVAWAKPNGPGPGGPNEDFGMIILKDVDAYTYEGLYWNAADSHFYFQGGYYFTSLVVSAQYFPAGSFYHVAGTYDGSTFKLYVNGSPEGQLSSSQTIVYDPSIPWTIGATAPYFRGQGYLNTFNGVIDEVAVYNRALTSNEVAALYAAGSAGMCLTNGLPPVITTQPTNQIETTGDTVTFAASASGTAPLSYQWQFNGTNLTDNARITGSQSNSLTIANALAGDGGNYQVVVTNAYGSVTSAVAALLTAGMSWDLAEDWNPPANPNGAWTYGDYDGGLFINLTYTTTPFSEYAAVGGRYSDGFILKNLTGSAAYGIDPGQVSLESDWGTAVARWTAPTSGRYDISVLIGGTTAGEVGGFGNAYAQYAGLNINMVGQPADSFTNNVKSWAFTNLWLNAGTTLDAYVAYPGYANGGNSQTIFHVTLATTCPAITLTPATLPAAEVGVAYSQSLGASGGAGPSTFVVTGGSLPAGLNMTNGVISGSPSGAGTNNFTVTATDTNSCTGSQSYALVVRASGGLLTNGGFENGLAGWTVEGSETITASSTNPPPIPDGSGDAGLATTLGLLAGSPSGPTTDVFPVEGANFALISNGGAGRTATRLSQTFSVPNNPGNLSFNYRFLTQEKDSGPTWNDAFVAQISTNTVVWVTRNDLQPGGVGELIPAAVAGVGGYEMGTAWRSVTVDLAPYAGQTVTLSFTVWDVGDDNSDTVVALDGVVAGGAYPIIVTQPTNQVVPVGGIAVFAVQATGSTPLSCQWQFNGTNLTDSAKIIGSQSNVLSIISVLASNAGSYAVVVSNGFGTASSQATLGVLKGTPTLTWNVPAAVPYGTGLDTNQLNATLSVPGNPVYNPLAGTVLPAGTNLLSVIFTPTDSADYNAVTGSVSLVVQRVPLRVTANNLSRMYGAVNPVFTVTLIGVTNGDNITGNYSLAATPASPVGIYPVVPLLSDPGNRLPNYNVSTNYGSLRITNALLIVTATNVTRPYGQPNPPLGGTITGLQNGDNITANYSCSATPTSPAGTNSIVPSLVDPGNLHTNYQVTLVRGTLTIAPPPPPTITAVAPNAGPTSGGTTVAIAGTGFESGATVGFGGLVASNVNVLSSSNLTVVTPPSGAGSVNVVLANADGQSVTVTNGFTYLSALLVTNGGFESGLAGWTVQGSESTTASSTNPPPIPDGSGDTGLATTLGMLAGSHSGPATDVLPVEGSAFALISNGGPGRTATRLSQTFSVPSNPGNLSFNYRFLTTEMDSGPTWNDAFVAQLNTNTVVWVTRNDLQPGGVGALTPAAITGVGGYAMGTAWRSVSVDLSPYAGQSVTLSFTVWDVGDDSSDTVVALDGVVAGGAYPIIVTQPTNQVVPVGGTAVFAAQATGSTPLSYQWRFNGTNLTNSAKFIGSQSNVLTIASVLASDAGTNYSVVVSNAFGTATSQAATLSVTKGTPVLSWNTPEPILYGTALDTNQLNASVPPSVPGRLGYSPTNGAVLSAGTNVLSVVFTPTDSADYNAVTGSVSVVVLRAPLRVTATNATRPYGQPNPPLGGTITGLQNGDPITANYTCSATPASPVTTYPILPSLVDANNRLPNYVITTNNGMLTVTKAATTLAWTNPAPIIYGSVLGTNQLNAVPSVPATPTYTPGTGTVLSAGTNTLWVVFLPVDTSNYTGATGSVSLVVMRALLSVTASDATRPYGQTNPVFTGTITGATNGDNITANYTCSATVSSPASTYSIVPSLVDANNRLPNYIVTTNYGTLTVTSGIQAHDDAAAYDAAGGTWASGMDFGFGLQPWVIARSGTAHQGAFIGDGGNIATTNNSAWGLYANGTPTNLAVAYRGFSNSVPVGMAFKLQWRSGSIGNNPYNFAGFSLRTGNASATTSDYSAGERFSFFYQGGGQDNARIRDGSGTLYAPAPGINFSNLHRGVAVELTLLSSNTYRLMIADAATTNVLAVFDNRLLAGSGAIQSVALYDSQTDPGLGEYDGNQLFNNMEISSPSSSLPPVIQSVTRSAGQLGLNWSALAGRSYQVQYKTNPAQAYWSNLSGSVTATNFTGTATDAVGPDRQRVYRIFLAP